MTSYAQSYALNAEQKVWFADLLVKKEQQTLPYLPTEIITVIFDYKYRLEERDNRNALNEEFTRRWEHITHGYWKDGGKGWWRQASRVNINSYTACRRCNCYNSATLDNEFPDYDVIKGPYWGALECSGCLTPKENEEERLIWCILKGGDWLECKEHPLWREGGYGA
jgi:hypothetical protein|tara:strand:- start:2167 stop:2667 length:501 start_codon:yes stop_codon:yes gene_type:complete